ncbi:MAG: nucleotide excision repair endonuclease, partial [Gemmatimonadota bacterium]
MARKSPVPAWVPANLPPAPGVYQFEDELGTPIYVGKSVNLRRRVRGYFYGGGPSDERMAMMVRLARGVRIHRTGTDLEALLEEAERIERHRPA